MDYSPDTGEFIWIKSRHGVRVGAVAGTVDKGYRRITIDYKQYFAHQLVWLYHHGDFPEKGIDHINGNPSDNKLGNLRVVSQVENGRNQKRSTRNTLAQLEFFFEN